MTASESPGHHAVLIPSEERTELVTTAKDAVDLDQQDLRTLLTSNDSLDEFRPRSPPAQKVDRDAAGTRSTQDQQDRLEQSERHGATDQPQPLVLPQFKHL